MKSTLFYALLFVVAFSVNSLSAQEKISFSDYKPGEVIASADVRKLNINQCFTSEEISKELMERMCRGRSWKENTPDSLRSQLRYLRVLHCNANGLTQVGEMVVNEKIADDVLIIFRELYTAGYRIERMQLIDDFGADDYKSMIANNSSSFNFRFMTGSTTKISLHGLGLAIDINPLYNPYVKGDYVEPEEGRPYAFNRKTGRYIILGDDLAVKLFKKYGFSWGGDWKSLKDYQHFERK